MPRWLKKTLIFLWLGSGLLSWAAFSAPLTITMAEEMRFGQFIPNSGGVLVLSPAGDLQRNYGDVLPVAGAQAGRMLIEGDSGDVVWISFAQSSIDLIHKNDATHSMQLGEIALGSTAIGTLYPGVPGIVLDASGVGEFTVGGTLFVSENQPPGEYEGYLQINVVRN